MTKLLTSPIQVPLCGWSATLKVQLIQARWQKLVWNIPMHLSDWHDPFSRSLVAHVRGKMMSSPPPLYSQRATRSRRWFHVLTDGMTLYIHTWTLQQTPQLRKKAATDRGSTRTTTKAPVSGKHICSLPLPAIFPARPNYNCIDIYPTGASQSPRSMPRSLSATTPMPRVTMSSPSLPSWLQFA